jgi:hypothetical protein
VSSELAAHPFIVAEETNAAAMLMGWASKHSKESAPVASTEAEKLTTLLDDLDVKFDSLYAECHLDSGRQLDLLLSYGRGSPHIAPLRARLAQRGSRARASERAAWSAAESFFERWSDVGDPLSEAASLVWLEFDDVSRVPETVAPSLSACIAPRYAAHADLRTLPVKRELEDALVFVYAGLRGTLPPEVRRRIRHAVGALPDAGRFIHVSWMASRPSLDAKLYGVVPRHDLIGYLKRLGFAGRLDRVQEFVNLIATSDICGEDIYFDLNLSNMWNVAGASLGVAFSQQQVMSSAARDVGRRALLGRLVTCRHCTSDQARALANWVEMPVAGSPPIPGEPRGYRWLDIKAVLGADGDVSLKAYLGFGTIRSPFVFGPRSSQAVRS